MKFTLVIGNKNYSSWSMRAWLLLRLIGVEFEEISIALYREGSREAVRRLGGETGLAPVLIADAHPIWDTMAITEFLAERHPLLWPSDPFERARARSYCGEVHSSLSALREAMPVNTRGRRRSARRSEQVEADVDRVTAIWSTAGRGGSPWLFDRFGAADIMFAPVATRFQTYDVRIEGAAKAYQQTILGHALVQEWLELGAREADTIEMFELPEA